MFHREGQKIILITFFSVGIAIVLAHFYIVEPWLQYTVQILALIILILILQLLIKILMIYLPLLMVK